MSNQLNSQNSQQITLNFLETLVQAMLGIKIQDIPIDKQAEVVNQCARVFADYIQDYTDINFGPKQAMRLRAVEQFPDQNIFEKFPEMEGVFQQATLSFLNSLKQPTKSDFAAKTKEI